MARTPSNTAATFDEPRANMHLLTAQVVEALKHRNVTDAAVKVISPVDLRSIKLTAQSRRWDDVRTGQSPVFLLTGSFDVKPGDYLLVRVRSEHFRRNRESVYSRLTRSSPHDVYPFPDDLLLLSNLNRFAPNEVHARSLERVTTGDSINVVSRGGGCGVVIDDHGKHLPAVEVVGVLVDEQLEVQCASLDFPRATSGFNPQPRISSALRHWLRQRTPPLYEAVPPATSHFETFMFGVTADMMDRGKTEVASQLSRLIYRVGLPVAAIKPTGTEGGNDRFRPAEAGAQPVVTFYDAGLNGTAGISDRDVEDVFLTLHQTVLLSGVRAIVVEFSDGLYEPPEVKHLVQNSDAVTDLLDGVIYCAGLSDSRALDYEIDRIANDVLHLFSRGKRVLAVSGMITSNQIATYKLQERLNRLADEVDSAFLLEANDAQRRKALRTGRPANELTRKDLTVSVVNTFAMNEPSTLLALNLPEGMLYRLMLSATTRRQEERALANGVFTTFTSYPANQPRAWDHTIAPGRYEGGITFSGWIDAIGG